MKKAVSWDVAPCKIVLTDVSEERIASIFMVEDKKKSASHTPLLLLYSCVYSTGLLHLLCWFARGFLLVFYPEDGRNTFLRNIG
jgi:hypothetical protein